MDLYHLSLLSFFGLKKKSALAILHMKVVPEYGVQTDNHLANNSLLSHLGEFAREQVAQTERVQGPWNSHGMV